MTEQSPGGWRLQTTSDPDAVTGETRRLSRTFRGTRPEATAELQRFVTESGAGLQGGSSVTVAVLLESFMLTATLAPTTRQDWSSVIDRYLIPELGVVPLWKLTPRDCDQMYQRLRLGGLGASRVRNAHVVLHRAMAQALRWGWVTRNPVSDATRPEVPRSTVTPPNLDDVRLLLSLAQKIDPKLSCWLDIATGTGARRVRDLRAPLERHRPRTFHRPDRTIRRCDEGSRRVHHHDQDRPFSSRVAPGSSRPLTEHCSRHRAR